ncbi:heat shock protein [Cardiosporidium cionae]|uniref:Heat shock protein n=1 Tax=Cardiosporidium cionae TaxID=476202 RepID=A0ABQ7JBI5_9APIC|nr:heat shock protein [Cardiosporidium cionae]|eukprot:KAF8821372.1 heat shock protein [Cardiosporidium cionae]
MHYPISSNLTEPNALLSPNNIAEAFPKRGINDGIQFVPRMDALFDESSSSLILLFDISGIAKDALKVEIGQGLLTISGERPQNSLSDNYGDQLTFHIQERTNGYFYRQFRLPPNSIESTACAGLTSGNSKQTYFDKIKAFEYDNICPSKGILEIKLTCIQVENVRTITIVDGKAQAPGSEKKDSKKK